MNRIKIKNFSYRANQELVIESFDFDFKENTIYSIVGPSGCGKTTILNILSGIVPSNSILPSLSIGYMFQDDLLLPWRTLRENITLGIEVLKKEINNIVINSFIKSFDLQNHENYYPAELSGGMKQRAALIRTLLLNPNFLLLDESFSNLDFDIKIRIQKEILNYQKENKTTIILVTHDIEDAIALSDEILILSEKPTTIKKAIKIEFDLDEKNPLEVRKSYKFTDYFTQIIDELKYLS